MFVADPFNFTFDVFYKPTSQNINADYCPRIPCQSMQSGVDSLQEGRNTENGFKQFALHQIQQLRAKYIASETRKGTHLGKIIQELELGRNLAQSGYKTPEVKYTLTVGCLLFVHRVVVPSALRQASTSRQNERTNTFFCVLAVNIHSFTGVMFEGHLMYIKEHSEAIFN